MKTLYLRLVVPEVHNFQLVLNIYLKHNHLYFYVVLEKFELVILKNFRILFIHK